MAHTLNVTGEQYRAVGHMTLQWAFLEAEIDRRSFGSTGEATHL